MPESTKINFNHRQISRLSDFTELMEMLFPGSRNQRYAAACLFFALKWDNSIVPNLGYLESEYGISRRVLQRARAKLSRIGIIEHVSHLNNRYDGQHGWRLSSRCETSLKQMAEKCTALRDKRSSSRRKDEGLLLCV